MAETIGLEAVLDLSKWDKNVGEYTKSIGKMENVSSDFVKSANADFSKLGDNLKDIKINFDIPKIDFGNIVPPKINTDLGSFVDFSDILDENGDALTGFADEADGAIGGLGGKVGGLGAAFTGMAAVATGAITGIVAVVGVLAAAMVAIGKVAFDTAVDYDNALADIEARTGKTGTELERLGEIAKEVYTDNWGESLGDVADALIQVEQVLGKSMGSDALKDATTDALIFRDVFDININESIRASRSAVENFGVTSSQAFDMMADTIQDVGDPAGDLADTVNEYSVIFAKAGFSAEEMFAILESGVAAGGRNFDQIADTVKEFTIRIIDGSDSTYNALNSLYEITGNANSSFFDLQEGIDATTAAIEANEQALVDSEGAYEAQAKVVDNLEKTLSDAQRKLDELSRPNLAGMEEYDDKLFDLEQQAKQTQLGLIDLEEDTPQFEAAQKRLEEINKEIDRVSLQRDLEIEPQLRAIEDLAKSGTEEFVTYEQALADVAKQKDYIAQLEGILATNEDKLTDNANAVQGYKDNQVLLNEQLTNQQNLLAQTESPAQALFDALANGSTTSRDAMTEIITALGQVDDKLLQDQIGVALFGTKWEDVGAQVIAAINPTNLALEQTTGTVDAMNAAISEGGLSGFAALWRDVQVALEPLGAMFLNLAQSALPFLGEAASALAPSIQRIVDIFSPVFSAVIGQIGENIKELAIGLGLVEEGATVAESLQSILEPVLFSLGAIVLGTAGAFNIMIEKLNLSVNALRTVKDSFDDLYQSITDALNALNDFISKQTGLSGSTVNSALNIATGGIYGGLRTGGNLLGFADGGIVPGPIGAPMIAMVHGGETVVPANQSASTVININGIQVSGGNGVDINTALQEAFGIIRQQIAVKMR